MSEVVSFGNIVNSLRAVRNDYNEHLKAVPQYEAFLLVESSAQSVADKLRAVAPAMAADIGEALEATKAKFRQHLTNVPEYRALLAIEKLIGDIAADLGVQPVAASPVEPPVEAAPTISPLAGVEQPVVEQPAPAPAEVAALLSNDQTHGEVLEPIAQAEHTAELPGALPGLAQADAQGAITTADALSQLQVALQADAAAPDMTHVAEAVAEPVEAAPQVAEPALEVEAPSPVALEPVEFAHTAERAA